MPQRMRGLAVPPARKGWRGPPRWEGASPTWHLGQPSPGPGAAHFRGGLTGILPFPSPTETPKLLPLWRWQGLPPPAPDWIDPVHCSPTLLTHPHQCLSPTQRDEDHGSCSACLPPDCALLLDKANVSHVAMSPVPSSGPSTQQTGSNPLVIISQEIQRMELLR